MKISQKTLFYMKEYGPHSHVAHKIVKESLRILILAAIISSMGGIVLEKIKPLILAVIPMIILLPSLNNMNGDFATIISTKFSAYLHSGKITEKWWRSEELQKLFIQIFIISTSTAFTSALIAVLITSAKYILSPEFVYKIFSIAILDVWILMLISFTTVIIGGLYFYRKNEDPNNFLIPITNSVADFGNLLILGILIGVFFG